MRPNLSYTSETGKGADIGWETYSLKRKVTCILSDFTNFSNILVHVWYKSEYLGMQCKVKHVISSVARINYSISIKNYVHGISLIRHVILLALFSRSNTQPSIFKLIQNQIWWNTFWSIFYVSFFFSLLSICSKISASLSYDIKDHKSPKTKSLTRDVHRHSKHSRVECTRVQINVSTIPLKWRPMLRKMWRSTLRQTLQVRVASDTNKI